MNYQFIYLNNYTLIPRGISRGTTMAICKPFAYQISVRHYPVGDKMGKVVVKEATSKALIPSSSKNLALIPYVHNKEHATTTTTTSTTTTVDSNRVTDIEIFDRIESRYANNNNSITPITDIAKEIALYNIANNYEPTAIPLKHIFFDRMKEYWKQVASFKQALQIMQDDLKVTPKEVQEEKETSKSSVLKSKTGKEYKTDIDQNTTKDTINDQALIEELIKRELTKNDDGKTSSIIKDAKGNDTVVGECKNKIKLTPLGQAYAKTIKPQETFANTPDTNTNFEYMVAIPKVDQEHTFLETGKQKHLLLIHNKANNEYYAIGYFTSKTSGELLSDIQFKKFQTKKEQDENTEEKKQNNNTGEEKQKENTAEIKAKKQYIAIYQNAELLHYKDFDIAAHSTDYLKQISKNVLNLLKQTVTDLHKEDYTHFSPVGLTKEDCIAMCLTHDKNVLEKKKHPMTQDQLNEQTKGKEKQKLKQQETNNCTKEKAKKEFHDGI